MREVLAYGRRERASLIRSVGRTDWLSRRPQNKKLPGSPMASSSPARHPSIRMKPTEFELSNSQVDTPPIISKLTWDIVGRYRSSIHSVLDLGAGDGRFALSGIYGTYQGVEIDRTRIRGMRLPERAKMHVGCAFTFPGDDYSVCIGNPPYVKHHDLDEVWRDKTAERMGEELGVVVNRKANLYVYFLALALQKTKADGLVAMVVPMEWTIRPSAEWLRTYIANNKWDVDIYRFKDRIFHGVETTASITIVNKKNGEGRWNYFDIRRDASTDTHVITAAKGISCIAYEKRGTVWGMRGMSPGTQEIFTLTEGERIHAGLKREDVVPCVTSLRRFPTNEPTLNSSAFKKHFIDAGEKCWLIRSFEDDMHPRLSVYLHGIPEPQRQTWTCLNREVWYRFPIHPVPGMLVSGGFSGKGPKTVINLVKAHAVGAVHGIHSDNRFLSWRSVQTYIERINFARKVLSHSGALRKIEIRQLNCVLNAYMDTHVHA